MTKKKKCPNCKRYSYSKRKVKWICPYCVTDLSDVKAEVAKQMVEMKINIIIILILLIVLIIVSGYIINRVTELENRIEILEQQENNRLEGLFNDIENILKMMGDDFE